MYPSGGALITAQRKCRVRDGKLGGGMRGARGVGDICLAMTSMSLTMLWYSARSVSSCRLFS